jgi:hypothetical protein
VFIDHRAKVRYVDPTRLDGPVYRSRSRL